MPNILPETEVRESLLVDILRAKGEGYIYHQTSDDWDCRYFITDFTMVHIIYTLLCGWIT